MAVGTLTPGVPRMRIYTKSGDTGQTGLFGGARVSKDDVRVDCYGIVDELNACLGVVASTAVAKDVGELLTRLQSDLFVVGAELACVPEKREALRLHLIDESDITRLEQTIDEYTKELPELKTFILPGGSNSAAMLHLARTICRRAERRTITLGGLSEVSGKIVIYLNRLGDLLFVLARVENRRNLVADVPWQPRIV